MVLNVDHHRERCQIAELNQAKLRRVAFCVDVEIASGPRYDDDSIDLPEPEKATKDKKRLSEKGEGAALKHPEAFQDGKPDVAVNKAPPAQVLGKDMETKDAAQVTVKDTTKKKEKKKRSEEERKARKEKKRKQAEENGAIPVEVIREASNRSDSSGSPDTKTPKTQATPTTDPVRIYRRCCQLRETPILKKITEQLGASVTAGSPVGLVNKLDLTGYLLHLPDLVTLGDYLAVVPVKELILENCGLTDEGTRVILAGLLAAKPIDSPTRRPGHNEKDGEVVQGGVIERLVLKDNPKIGRDGWRHICLFINMSRSLKSLDVSKIPFPQALTPTSSHAPAPNAQTPNIQAPTVHPHTPNIHTPHLHAPNFHVHGHNAQAPDGHAPTVQPSNGNLTRTTSSASVNMELSQLLSKAVGDRLAGNQFELFVLAECGFNTDQLGDLVDGFINSGLRRLGLAGNNISPDGMKHITRYIREGNCEGLDLGGNDLRDQVGTIVDALTEPCELYALSLADCNLTPESLWTLFPALAKLKNFRFIDLSQNHDLFETNPSAISLLRRYLPKMPLLKRIHLSDVSMTPEQAIALAEILPDTPSLAHVNIMENPELAALATAKGEANQEEACALYASLMAAVRVSRTIVCIDIEVPSNDSSEVVKALAKQVIAYCLWNMERGPVSEISDTVLGASETNGAEKGVAVPDVLLHLVGHADAPDARDDEEPAPDEDYVIGGTGVVKALGICLLNRGNDARRTNSGHSSPGRPSTPTDAVSGGKAKQMSKNLLGSARRIRARLQPALLKEASSGLQYNYRM
jgi:Ran GTPase-activating protein (RanGAP) involved in mRNA processing and transport